MSVHNSGLHTLTPLNDHLQSRSLMTSSLFYRRLATCFTMTGALSILNFSALFSIPKYKPWISWASVHATLAQVNIVKEEIDPDPTMPNNGFKNIQITWWGIFAISVVYIVLSFAIGEEARDAYKWIASQASQKKTLHRSLVLPV
jgi:pheromone a factor receptor